MSWLKSSDLDASDAIVSLNTNSASSNPGKDSAHLFIYSIILGVMASDLIFLRTTGLSRPGIKTNTPPFIFDPAGPSAIAISCLASVPAVCCSLWVGQRTSDPNGGVISVR